MKTPIITIVSALIAFGAQAQTQGEELLAQNGESDAPVEEIVILGQKLSHSLNDVTSSVFIETAEEIAREPVRNLYDLVVRIPNVTSSFGGQGFAIRGVDQRGVGGSGQTLSIYVDDAPLGNRAAFFGPTDAWDLGQVEVYRGPQSTNFGRNALAGAIYIRTQDPDYEWDFKARGEVGNNDAFQGALALGGPIVDDVLAFRVSGSWRESDGFVRNTLLDEPADKREQQTARIKFLFEPADNLRIISTTTYNENYAGQDFLSPSNGDFVSALSAGQVNREVRHDISGREGTETFLQSVNAVWSINDEWELQSITSYQTTDILRLEDADRSAASLAVLNREGTDRAISEELRLRFANERLNALVGFYFVDSEEGFDEDFVIPASVVNPLIPPSLLVSRGSTVEQDARNYAGFIDGDIKLNEQFDLLLGLRYDHERQNDFQGTTTVFITDIPPGFEFLRAFEGSEEGGSSASFDAWLPKAGVRWHAHEDVTVAFVAQRAYRAGGADFNFIDGSLDSFDPEFLWNYEISTRATLLDGQLSWNSNLYYSDWKRQQVRVPLESQFQIFETVNAGSSSLYGFETDLSYAVNADLEIYAGFGYSIAEFDDFANADFDPTAPESEDNQPNFRNNRFPYAPRISFNGGFDYTHNSGVFGGLDVNYQSFSYGDVVNISENRNDARTLVSGRLGYHVTENITVTAFVRNLFDEDYFTLVDRDEGLARLGDSRTWAVRLDVDF
ncbi:MAG: TonB-dependent receptor [Sphingomonadales bacterium]|jgi:outer membrane receptor protein involved in Fe transport